LCIVPRFALWPWAGARARPQFAAISALCLQALAAVTRRAWPHTPSISGKKFPMDLHTDPQQRIALATMSAQYNCPRGSGL